MMPWIMKTSGVLVVMIYCESKGLNSLHAFMIVSFIVSIRTFFFILLFNGIY